jgi:hypothetical protein
MRNNEMQVRVLRGFIVAFIALFAAGVVAAQQPPAGGQGGGRGAGRGPATPGLTLTSTAWPDGGEIPAKHAGQMGPPALSWTNVPMGTVSRIADERSRTGAPAGSVSGDITTGWSSIPRAHRRPKRRMPAVDDAAGRCAPGSALSRVRGAGPQGRRITTADALRAERAAGRRQRRSRGVTAAMEGGLPAESSTDVSEAVGTGREVHALTFVETAYELTKK